MAKNINYFPDKDKRRMRRKYKKENLRPFKTDKKNKDKYAENFDEPIDDFLLEEGYRQRYPRNSI